jgi:hypothetical protein
VEPHETVALECIREPGLKLQVIFNREAVRVLPSGVIKATGRKRALEELQLAVHNIVAIGDSENEHAFIDASECAVAVANGVPSLREHADFVTSAPADAGVLQVIAVLLRDDFNAERALDASSLVVGTARDGRPLRIPSCEQNILITGASGSGKSDVRHRFCRATRCARLPVLHPRSRGRLRRSRRRHHARQCRSGGSSRDVHGRRF